MQVSICTCPVRHFSEIADGVQLRLCWIHLSHVVGWQVLRPMASSQKPLPVRAPDTHPLWEIDVTTSFYAEWLAWTTLCSLERRPCSCWRQRKPTFASWQRLGLWRPAFASWSQILWGSLMAPVEANGYSWSNQPNVLCGIRWSNRVRRWSKEPPTPRSNPWPDEGSEDRPPSQWALSPNNPHLHTELT